MQKEQVCFASVALISELLPEPYCEISKQANSFQKERNWGAFSHTASGKHAREFLQSRALQHTGFCMILQILGPILHTHSSLQHELAKKHWEHWLYQCVLPKGSRRWATKMKESVAKYQHPIKYLLSLLNQNRICTSDHIWIFHSCIQEIISGLFISTSILKPQELSTYAVVSNSPFLLGSTVAAPQHSLKDKKFVRVSLFSFLSCSTQFHRISFLS